LTIDVTLPQNEIVQKIKEQLMETKYSLGILGLGVMGRSPGAKIFHAMDTRRSGTI